MYFFYYSAKEMNTQQAQQQTLLIISLLIISVVQIMSLRKTEVRDLISQANLSRCQLQFRLDIPKCQ